MNNRLAPVLRMTLWIGYGALGASSAEGQGIQADSLIAQGVIGPVQVSMSEDDLVDLVGSASIERFDAYIGEGFCAPGSRVFPGSDAEIEIMWRDSTYSEIVVLSLMKPGSPWRTPKGIRVGSTVRELEAITGGPIEFSGWGWDYGGGASWSEDDVRLGLRLGATPESERGVVGDPRYVELLGDRIVRSDHPLARRLTILIDRISLSGVAPSETQYECG